MAVGSETPTAIELRDAVSAGVVARKVLAGGSGRLAFSPDGRFLATCARKQTVLYEVRPSRTREHVTVEAGEPGTFSLSADGNQMATLKRFGSMPQAVRPTDELNLLTLFQRYDGQMVEAERIQVPAVNPEDCRVGLPSPGEGLGFAVACRTGRDGGTVQGATGSLLPTTGNPEVVRLGLGQRLWVADDRGLQSAAPGHSAEVAYRRTPEDQGAGVRFTAFELDRDGRAVAGLRDGRLLQAASTGELTRWWHPFKDERITSVTPLDEHGTLLAGNATGELVAIDTTNETIRRPAAPPHRAAITGVKWLPGGAFLTTSADHTIRLWSALDEPILTLREGGPIEQAELAGGELYVRVRGEWGVRVHHLGRLAQELRDMGIDPGFRAEPDSPGGPPMTGPRVSYFGDASHDWLVHRRRGKTVACDKENPPSRWLPPGPFSARWEGGLRAPRAGRWEFKAEGRGSARMWVSGKPVLGLEDLSAAPAGKADLSAQALRFRLDFRSNTTNGRCRLLWRPEGGGEFTPVPAEAFTPP